MAIEVLSDIKTAEEQALETRRLAAIAANDAIKLAQQENEKIKDELLTQARRDSIEIVEDAQQTAKVELETRQKQRINACETLKQAAQARLSRAADLCIERILQ